MPTPLFIGFDIETRPLPELVDRFAKPFPDFDPLAVKYGNTKDPVKRAALLEAKQAEHEEDRVRYWANLKDRAALDPFTGAVICIGMGLGDQGEPEIVAEATEGGTIAAFWDVFSSYHYATSKFVYWSGSGDPAKCFDIDYLVTRSRILGVTVPPLVRNGRYYASRIVDLAAEFLLFQRDKYLSLSKAADLLGLYTPNGKLFPKADDAPVTGANFFQWWDGTMPEGGDHATQRMGAEGYLINDVRHLQALAPRILP